MNIKTYLKNFYSEFIKRKKVHLMIIAGIIIFLFIVSGLIIWRYQIKGENNLPFRISKMIVISSAEGNEIPAPEGEAKTKWNFEVSQINDIYFQMEKNNNKNDDKKDNIKSITFENIKIENAQEPEKFKLYRGNSEAKIVEDDSHAINGNLSFSISNENDMENLKMSSAGGVILLRSVNQNIGELRNNDDAVVHDGTMISQAQINSDSLKYTLSIDVVYETEKNIKYRGTIKISLPVGNLETEGKGEFEKTDFSDVIFKRE